MKNNIKIKYIIYILFIISIVSLLNFNKFYVKKEIITSSKETMIEATKTATTGWTATFNKNGASSITKSKISCPAKAPCNITLPKITRSGYTILGWATTSSATKAKYKVGQTIVLTKNTTLYAITSKKLKVTFNLNGAKKISANSLSCTLYNKNTSCSITLPTITAVSGFKVLGWAQESNAIKAVVLVGKSIKISSNMNFYAITQSTSGCKVTYKKNNAESLSYESKTYYRYNGSKDCTITDVPYIYREGYETHGFSDKSKGSSIALLNKKISGNATYYALAINQKRKKALTLSTSYKVSKVAIDVEKKSTLYYNVYSKYVEYLNYIKQNMPYLFNFNGKISMISADTYVDIWGKASAGVTYTYVKGHSNIDVKISNSKTVNCLTLGAFVHELTHAWDNYFKAKTGKRISEQKDVMELFEQYKNKLVRPLVDGAYKNPSEFIASMVTFYFWDKYTKNDVNQIYINQNMGATELKKKININDEMIKVIEKYIKYANDGYIKK